MLINHIDRTISVKDEDLLNKDGPLYLGNLNVDSIIFYTIGERISDGSLAITIKDMRPASWYLQFFNISDYKVIKE